MVKLTAENHYTNFFTFFLRVLIFSYSIRNDQLTEKEALRNIVEKEKIDTV